MDDKTRKKVLGDVNYREITLKREQVDEKLRTAYLAFSSETPVGRWYGTEILDHAPESVRMERLMDGAPFLLQHDPADQIGVVTEASVDQDRVGRAVIRFSRSPEAEVIFQDVLDGIRTKISVGYMVHEMKLDESGDNGDTYRITDWEPIEISLVSVPADNTVGVGRDFNKQQNLKGEENMEETTKNTEPTVAVRADAADPAKLEADRKSQIEEIGKRFSGRISGGEPKMRELVRDAVELGVPLDLFRGTVFGLVNDTKPLEGPVSEIGLTPKETKRFSLARAIHAMASRNKELAAFEFECSEAVMKNRTNPLPEPRGIYVPHEIQTRDMTVSSATAGGNIVGTNLMGGSFIEVLRNRSVALRAGVQTMSGLVGNVAIPKQTAAGTFGWIATENTAASETAPTVGQVTLSPKTGGAFVDYSRLLLLQSTPSIDALVENDLRQITTLAVDAAVFHGSGASGQPTGIASTGSIGSVSGTDYSWTSAVEHETDVAGANADIATMYYVMGAAARGTLKTRPIAIGYPQFLIGFDNTMNGYPVLVSNQINSGFVFFGDFSQAILGEWGVVDVLSDPYTGSNAGTTRVTVFVTVDVGVRQPAAFSVCSTLT